MAGFFDDVSDIAGDVLGAVGNAAKPIMPVLGFAGINSGPTGSEGGFSLDNLMSGLRQGVGAAALANPLGLIDMARHAWDDHLTPLEKGLGIAGLVLGAGALGRHEYRRFASSRELMGQIPETLASSYTHEPASIDAFESVGLPPLRRRPAPHAIDSVLDGYVPGISHRSAMVLTADDAIGTADALGRWDRSDPAAHQLHTAKLGTIVDMLAAKIAPEVVEGGLDADGLRGAQLDLAKAASAMDQLVFSGKGKRTEQFRKTLARALEKPGLLKPGEMEALVNDLATFGEATQRIGDPDLQFDPIAKMVGFTFNEDGMPPSMQMDRPAWGGEVFDQGKSTMKKGKGYASKGEKNRHIRLRRINYRTLSEAGDDFLGQILDIGMSGDIKLELGQEWYTVGRDETYRQHGTDLMPRLLKQYGPGHWEPNTDHALAAVSLTSAGETWQTNISKAMDALEVVGREDVGDPGFQAWLRGEPGGMHLTDYQNLFAEIHKDLNGRKMKFDKYTLKKLLRMREESPETIFQTSGGEDGLSGMKQKHFYLNLKDPTLRGPVTVDRHAYDAWLGLDPGIGNRPLDKTITDETLYPMIAEAYRRLGQARGMLPNEVQAVIWETIKHLKDNHRKNVGTWATKNPWRLKRSDGSENPTYLALQGQGGLSMQELLSMAGSERMPVQFGPRRSDGSLELRTSPDGSLAVLGDPSRTSHDAARHLYPGVPDPDTGIVRWLNGVVRRVKDLQPIIDDFNGRLASGESTGHVIESYDNTSLLVHPMTVAGHHGMVTIPDANMAGFQTATKGATVREIPGSTIDKPTYSRAKLGIADLNPDTIDNPRTSQISNSPWAIVNAPPEQLAALIRDMRRKGYKPIQVEGTHGGLMALGMSPEEGVRLDKKYNRGDTPVITAAEARGDSRPVSHEEFQRLAGLGRAQLDAMQSGSSPTTGLDARWEAVKSETYAKAQESWGGATIDSHTGVEVPQGAKAYALTVKDRGVDTVSVPEGASAAEFNAAMDRAKAKFGPILERSGHHLGVFHDDANHRIDIDPVIVTSNHADVETIGAASHAVGGAYNFADGNGYFPPHVPGAGVATPDGLFFSDGRTMPSTGEVMFDQNAVGDHTEITLPNGRKVKFSVNIPGEFEDIPGATLFDTRGPKTGRRFHVELNPKSTTEDLAAMGRSLRDAGGTDLVMYGHTSDLGPEFTPTRDHIYTDGARTVVHRSLDPNLDSPHGFRSFVPNEEAVGLPTSQHSLNKRSVSERKLTHDDLSGLSFLNNEVAIASAHLPGIVLKPKVFESTVKGKRTTFFSISTAPGELPVVTLGRTAEEATGVVLGAISGHIDRRGNPVLVAPEGTTDMAPIYRAADTLRRMGLDPAKIHMEVGVGAGDVIHRLQPMVDKTPLQETVFNATGDPITFERPDPNGRELMRGDAKTRYLEHDPEASRARRQEAQAARDAVWELDNATSQMLGIHNMDFADAHPETAKVYRDALISLDNRFPGILQEYNPQHMRVVHDTQMSKTGVLAEMNFTGTNMRGTPGIQFNESWAKLSPDEYRAQVAERVPKGYWAPTDLGPILSTAAHEFMHVVHAVMHNRNIKAGVEFQRWMMKRFEFNGNGPGGAEINLGVSRYAADMWMEGVAEGLLEYHFSSTPRPLAIEIGRKFESFFKDNLSDPTHFQPGGKRPPVQGPPAPVMSAAEKVARFDENVRIAKKKGLNHPSTDLGGRMVDS